MAAGLHGSARTTPRVRAELQGSQEATRRPGRPLRAEPKDGRQMAQAHHDRRRADGTSSAAQLRAHRGRGGHRGRVPAPHPPAAGRRPGLPARDHPQALAQCPAPLPRPARHLPPARGEEKASKRKRFAETRIGYVHIDVCELRLAQGKLFMFLAIDRVSKFAHVAFLDANTKAERRRLPARGGRGLPLPPAHRADRQRHGVCRPAQEPRPPPGDRGHLRRPHLRPGLQSSTASGTGSPSPTTPGRTARPSG